MRTGSVKVVSTLLTCTVVLASFGSARADRVGSGQGTEAPDASDDGLLAEGIYRTGEITRDELIATGVAAGFAAEDAEAYLATVPLVDDVQIGHRLAGGGWTTTVAVDGAPDDVVTRGTYEVVDADTVIAPGICGPITLGYAIDGDSVTFDVIDDECVGSSAEHFFNTLNFESGPFARIEGDDGSAEVTLRMAVPYCDDDLEMRSGSRYTPAVLEFLNQVDELSDGTLTVEVFRQLGGPEFCGLADGEQQVVQAVIDGDADLAWAGTRVFDTFGVTGFQALHAPFLVDSYALQAAILDSDLPAEMLAGLDAIGLDGLAVLGGGLRKPIGREAPLIGPDDYAGITFQVYRSDVQAASVTALGATPTDVVAGVRDAGLVAGEIDGHEHSLKTYVIRENHDFAPYVTANVTFWPETIALIANPAMLAGLTTDQQAWIRQAAANASAASVELHDHDAELLATACEQGAVVAEATDGDLDALRAAVEPVYTDLRADPQTAAMIDEIAALKASLTPEPLLIPDACTAEVPEEVPAAASVDELLPEGTYRTGEVTRDELIATGVAAGFDRADVEAFVDADGIETSATFGLRLADGGWIQLYSYDGGPEGVGWRGTYEVVDEDTVIATDPCGPITYTYMLDGDELTLDMIDDQCKGAGGDTDVGELIAQTLIFETAPFIRVPDEAPASGAAAEPATYTSTSFVVPFEITLPEWVEPAPTVEEPNFVTWEATAADRGIRFLAPVNVYPPGATATTPLPDDYVGYLFSQADHGAIFEDVVETTVDGHPATVLTATVADSLDGGLGCQAEDLGAEDCFGLQPDLSLRLAVIEVGDQPLLIWVRDIRGVEAEYDTFDAMLASLQFLEPADAGEPSVDTIPTASTESAEDATGITPRYAGETDAPLGFYEYLPPS
ncbi:MAG: TRAP transporter substrate-binding protein [Acidimicrobiales bacterium]